MPPRCAWAAACVSCTARIWRWSALGKTDRANPGRAHERRKGHSVYSGQRSLRAWGTLCGAAFFRGVSDHPVHRGGGTAVRGAAACGRQVHSDGGRDFLIVRRVRGVGGWGQGHDRDQRPRFFAHAGGPWLRDHGGNPLCGDQRAARRAVYGPAHEGGAGRRESGPVGGARRPCDHRADRLFGAGRLCHDGGRLQYGGNLPHPGDPAVRRGGGPHARAS